MERAMQLITENRAVEARKALHLPYLIFTFCLTHVPWRWNNRQRRLVAWMLRLLISSLILLLTSPAPGALAADLPGWAGLIAEAQSNPWSVVSRALARAWGWTNGINDPMFRDVDPS